ncbi:hypothetical protein K7432_005614 [Basidiobolus ranarum]|uniref:DUF2421 domain-containing protein n=1 Tax=Basidiobolus ranarum TaxID=34480 RepID=A0ABR2W311_9FUNG
MSRMHWLPLWVKPPSRREWLDISKGVLAIFLTAFISILPGVKEYFVGTVYIIIIIIALVPPYLTLGAHIEAILWVTLALIWEIAYASLGSWAVSSFNRKYGPTGGRWIAAGFLIGVGFLAGYGRTRHPKFTLMWQLGAIASLYQFTYKIDSVKFNIEISYKNLIAQTICVWTSFLVNILFWPTSAGQKACQAFLDTLVQSRNILAEIPIALYDSDQQAQSISKLSKQAAQLQICVQTMQVAMTQAKYEVSYGRIAPRHIFGSVKVLAEMGRKLGVMVQNVIRIRNSLYGTYETMISDHASIAMDLTVAKDSTKLHEAVSKVLPAIESVLNEVIATNVKAIDQLIQSYQSLTDCQPSMKQSNLIDNSVTSTVELHAELQQTLEKIINMQKELLPKLRAIEGSDPGNWAWVVYTFFFGLQHTTSSIQELLSNEQYVKQERRDRKRLWVPKMNFSKWLRARELEEFKNRQEIAGSSSDSPNNDSTVEITNNAANNYEGMSVGQRMYEERKRHSKSSIRYNLWRALQWTKSSEVRCGIKLALTLFLYSLPAYFPSTSTWFTDVHGQWGLITIVIIFTKAVGSVIQTSYMRILSTILGGVLGYLAWLIAGGERWALPFVVCLLSTPAWYFCVATPYPRIGPTAIITFNAVVFNEFLYYNVGEKPIRLALMRWITVLLGIVLSMIVNVTLWPFVARIELRKEVSSLLNQMSKSISSVFSVNMGPSELNSDKKLRSEVESMLTKLQCQLIKIEGLLAEACMEPRLKEPFYSIMYDDLIKHLRASLDWLYVINATLATLPSKSLEDIIAPVSLQRREIIATTILNYYVLAGALKTNSPLPRYLPSVQAMRRSHYRRITKWDKATSPDYLGIYAYAGALFELAVEQDVLIELVKAIVGEERLHLIYPKPEDGLGESSSNEPHLIYQHPWSSAKSFTE